MYLAFSAQRELTQVPYEWYEVTQDTADIWDADDDEAFTYELPWTFPYFDKEIVALGIGSNGLIELLEEGETISDYTYYYDAWYYGYHIVEGLDYIFASHDDLSSWDYGYYAVEYFEADNVVVIYWYTETYLNSGDNIMNLFEVVLYPDGLIRWNYNYMDYEVEYYWWVWDMYGMFTGLYESDTGIEIEIGQYRFDDQTSYAINTVGLRELEVTSVTLGIEQWIESPETLLQWDLYPYYTYEEYYYWDYDSEELWFPGTPTESVLTFDLLYIEPDYGLTPHQANFIWTEVWGDYEYWEYGGWWIDYMWVDVDYRSTVVVNRMPADGTSTATITAVIRDEYGNLVVDGTTVYFETTAGTINPTETTTTDGIATATLIAPTTAETAVITVTADAVESSITIDFEADTFDISLNTGWNLISLPLIPENDNIENVLAGLDVDIANVEVVWAYDAATENWLVYTPGPAPDTLTTMEDGRGYWIRMLTPATLTVEGSVMPELGATPPTYDVAAGWNLIGFKSTVPRTADEYLEGVTWVSLWGYDAPDYFSVSGTENMVPGFGYWLYASEAGTIVP
jgi:hypothetical protein